MTNPSDDQACLACQRGPSETPLIQLAYLDRVYWICTQHLPLLIHSPSRLAGMLPGADRLSPADHDG